MTLKKSEGDTVDNQAIGMKLGTEERANTRWVKSTLLSKDLSVFSLYLLITHRSQIYDDCIRLEKRETNTNTVSSGIAGKSNSTEE